MIGDYLGNRDSKILKDSFRRSRKLPMLRIVKEREAFLNMMFMYKGFSLSGDDNHNHVLEG